VRRTTVVLTLLVLLVLGIVSLPLVASVLDGEGTENWILPVQLLAMAVIGALAGWLVPALGGRDASRRRGILIGAVLGVAAGVVGLVIFFLLLNGISGA
jgi:MFS family permease